MERSRRTVRRTRPVARNCPYCETKTLPDYKDTHSLGRYMTERGKIIPRSRTGICSKHQRLVTIAIKQARILALMPFVERT